MTALIKYEAACRALEEAHSVDEVKDIHDKAVAMRAYAIQAKNVDLEVMAAEVRARAERRLGEMLKAEKEAGRFGKGRRKFKSASNADLNVITLGDVGIDEHLSKRSQKLASISEQAFEAMVAGTRQQIKERSHRAPKDQRTEVNGARTIMASRAEPDDSLDYFPTPPFATRALCEVILPRYCVTRSSAAWEPACGEGHMAEVLGEYFREVVATDIHDYGYGDVADFLSPNTHCFPDWIVTNPPFNDKAEAFVLRAIEVARVGVAMFLRLQWLETIGRYERIFKPHPPALIAQFAERVPLCKGRWDPDGSTATAYLWIIWTRSHKGPTEFAWIPPGQRERLTRTDDRERFTAQPVARRTPEELEALSSTGEPVNMPPPVEGYASQHVFDGVRQLSSERTETLRQKYQDSELDIPDRLKRDANNRTPFHQNTGARPPLCDRDAPVNSAVESVTAPAAFSSSQEA